MLDVNKDAAKYENYGENFDDYPIDTSRLKNVIEVVAKDAGILNKLTSFTIHHRQAISSFVEACQPNINPRDE